jgi:hypothetical protein
VTSRVKPINFKRAIGQLHVICEYRLDLAGQVSM